VNAVAEVEVVAVAMRKPSPEAVEAAVAEAVVAVNRFVPKSKKSQTWIMPAIFLYTRLL